MQVLPFVRNARWGLAATIGVFAILAFMYATSPRSHTPGSDGHYLWLVARSIAFDHDIDYRNDYELCGDPHSWGTSRETGRTNNPFYVGPAIVWTPVLWVLRHVDRLPADAPAEVAQGCRGPLTEQTLWTGPILGGLTVWLMVRIARRRTGDGPAALTAGLLALGTPLSAYAALKPSYSHVYDTFWAALVILASLRAAERPRAIPRWALAGALVGIGLLQRPVSVAYGVVPAALAVAALWGEWGVLALSLGVLGLGAFAFGVLPQSLVYHYLYGSFWRGAPTGPLYMQYGHAHPWLLLFAPHGGFFLAAPVAWLAVPGAIRGARDRGTRTLVLALLLACVATTWISSAAIDWDASGTFGARRLTSLAPLLATPVAIAVDSVRRWLQAKPARMALALGLAVLAPVAFTISGAAYAQTMGKLPTDVGVSEAQLYGTGETMAWNVIEERIGAVSILPAELLFRVRYGLPFTSLRAATEAVYQRNLITLAWVHDTLDLGDEQAVQLTTGFEHQPHGIRMTGTRGTVVFASQWPFATGLYVRAHADRPTHVRVGRGRSFGRTDWYGDLPIDATDTAVRVDVPEGAFDSGINEFVFECDDPGAGVTVGSLKIEDTRTQRPTL